MKSARRNFANVYVETTHSFSEIGGELEGKQG